MKGTDFVTSNVPGAPFPVYLCGRRQLAQYPFGPLSGSAINVTLLSYVDEVNLGISSDPAAVTDREALLDDLRAGFDHVISG